MLYLSRFNFTLKYISETKMGKADRLSRTLDWKVGVENNKNKFKKAREKNDKVVRNEEDRKWRY